MVSSFSTAVGIPLHVEWPSKVDDAVQNAGSAMEALRNRATPHLLYVSQLASQVLYLTLWQRSLDFAPGRSRELHPASRLAVKATSELSAWHGLHLRSDHFLLVLTFLGGSIALQSINEEGFAEAVDKEID